MPLFSPQHQSQVETIARVGYANPFLPERIGLEQSLLGEENDTTETVWSIDPNGQIRRNVQAISDLAADLVRSAHERLAGGYVASQREAELYADLVLYYLFDCVRVELNATIVAAHEGQRSLKPRYWKRFEAEAKRLFAPAGRTQPVTYDPAHMFACFDQIHRAFFHVFYFIVGTSTPAAEMRAAIWESIFSHDLRRYHRSLYRHMHDVTTLVTGPSGTGKELVARAIGLSRYVPFNAATGAFADHFIDSFQAVNLSALSPTLIESELFGHCKGSFTGAVSERVGWLESCGSRGTVFLDEIGELDPSVQVKLLRVLQTRSFQRLGETTDRRFDGKIVAATNRVLPDEIAAGRFREDFYYRICSDRIETPSLRQQLDDSPGDLHRLLLFLADRVAPEEAESVAAEVEQWIDNNLPPDYGWPGNVRELEQCLRSILIHGTYRPALTQRSDAGAPWDGAWEAALQGTLTAEDLLRHYCDHIYRQCGSYEQTARRVGLDRRTVKRKIVELHDAT